eukprot:gene28161-37060_t
MRNCHYRSVREPEFGSRHESAFRRDNTPTGDTVDYTLQFKNSYDTADPTSYLNFACGQPGNIAGLDHMFSHTYIRDIPYLQFIEIPVSFADTDLCQDYKDISLQITATCERPTTRSEVYQYEIAYNFNTGVAEIQYDNRRGAEKSNAVINTISWTPAEPVTPAAEAISGSKCDCNFGGASDGYYSGYGGGVGGIGNGGGIAISSVEVDNLRRLSPTVPFRSDAEKKALLDAIEGLDIVNDMLLLISPKIVAANVTSQFRLTIQDSGVVEIQRSGLWGWGRDRTVALVVFEEETDFTAFMEMGSFLDLKKYLAQSVLQEREVRFRSGGDSQVFVEKGSLMNGNSADDLSFNRTSSTRGAVAQRRKHEGYLAKRHQKEIEERMQREFLEKTQSSPAQSAKKESGIKHLQVNGFTSWGAPMFKDGEFPGMHITFPAITEGHELYKTLRARLNPRKNLPYLEYDPRKLNQAEFKKLLASADIHVTLEGKSAKENDHYYPNEQQNDKRKHGKYPAWQKRDTRKGVGTLSSRVGNPAELRSTMEDRTRMYDFWEKVKQYKNPQPVAADTASADGGGGGGGRSRVNPWPRPPE